MKPRRDHQPADVHDHGGVPARPLPSATKQVHSRPADVLPGPPLPRAVVDRTADSREIAAAR